MTILKTLGLSGSPMSGQLLISRLDGVEAGELLDTLEGLISMGYVLCNKVNIRKMEDVQRAFFRTNPTDTQDLRDAVNPARRRAREQRTRRRRS